MKTVIQVVSLKKSVDVANVKMLLSQEEGVLAIEIKKSANSIIVVYDETYIKDYELEDIVEGAGFILK
ncbi:MAG: hypothetical protein ACRC41_01700 [Sarcina sp.]